MAAEIKKNNKPGLIFDSDLRLDRTASNADDTTFFRIATDDELNRYLDRSVQDGLLLLDEAQRAKLIEVILGYQKVQQYRNQINHASDTAFGLQSDRILPLDTAHIEQTLQDVADYLQEIRPMKPDVPEGVKALPVTKTIPAGAVPNL